MTKEKPVTAAKKRKLIFIGLGLFLCLMICIILTPVALRFYLETDHAQNLIQTKINENIPGTITWERLRFSLMRGEFELKDVRLRDPKDKELAGFDRLFINLSWLTLRQKTLTIEEITLEKPQADIRIDKDGKLNLMDAFPAPESDKKEEKKEPSKGPPVNIALNQLRILNGTVRYEMEAKALKTAVQDINLTGTDGDLLKQSLNLTIVLRDYTLESPAINTGIEELKLQAAINQGRIEIPPPGEIDLLKQSLNLALNIRETSLKGPKFDTRIDNLQLDASLENGQVDPLSLNLETDAGNLALSGKVTEIFTKQPLPDLSLDLETELAKVRETLGLEPVLTGQTDIHLSVKGQINDPQADLRLNYGGGELAGKQIDGIDLDCGIKARHLNIAHLLVKAASGELNLQGNVNLQDVFPGGFLSGKMNMDALAYNLTLEEKGINLSELIVGNQDIKGIVNADIAVDGRGISPETLSAKVNLNLFAEQLTASEKMATPIDLSVKTDAGLDQGLVTVKELEAKVGDIQLGTDGRFHIKSQEFDAAVRLNAPKLASNLQPLGIKDVYGDLDLDAKVSGSLRQPVFDCKLQGERLRFKDINIGKIRVNAASDASGVVNISAFEIENQGSGLQALGTVAVFQKDSMAVNPEFPMDFSLNLRDMEPTDFLAKLPVKVTAGGKLDLSGTMNDLKAALALQAKNLDVMEKTRAGEIFLTANLQGDVNRIIRKPASEQVDPEGVNASLDLKVRNLEAAEKVKAAGVSLTANLKGDVNALIQGNKGNADAFNAVLALETEKLSVDKVVKTDTISLNADIKGDVKHPKGTAKLIGKQIDLGVQNLREIRLDSQIDGQTIGIDSLEVTVLPKERIKAVGWISLDKQSYKLDISSKGLILEHIDKIREQNVASGRISFDLSGEGTFENPQVEGDVGLKNLRVKGKKIQDVNLHLSLADYLARVSGKLNFDLDGSFHIKEKNFSATVQFDKTDLSPYFKLANQTDLAGSLTGKIKADGNAGAIDKIQASADFSDMNLSLKGKEMVQSSDFKALFKSGEIALPGSVIRLLEQGNLEISGKGKPEGPLDIQIKGDIPLKLANQFTDAVPDITGDIGIMARVTGKPSKPDIRATIELKKVGLTVPGLSQQLHDLNGQIEVTPTLAEIKDVKGKLDDGDIRLSGKVHLKDFKPGKIDLELNADTLPVSVPDTLDILLNADLRINGTMDGSSVTGDVVLLEGTYHRDVDLSLLSGLKKATQKRRETAPKTSEPPNPFLKNMRLDISVTPRSPFVVDNNLALLDINPDLRIQGTPISPLISGRAQIESGTITYQKKEFDVTKGLIDFLNPYKIEPTLDIESEVNIREWLIVLEISGTPDQLNFKLSSTPEEEHGDILSLLVLGKTTREIGKSDGGTTKLPAQMVADIVESTVGEDIRKATGLDILKVEFQEDENSDASDRVRVTLGKELSRRMTVKYTMESEDGEMVQKGIAEYKFLENMMVTGFQDSKGVYGGELQFRMEFR